MKILVTSDNHLGFKERDPIRSNDSFLTFTEILAIGKERDVDLVLQAGDLFDVSSPSRLTLNNTICIMKYFMEGISDILPNKLKSRNHETKRPIIAIHGNHDDPSGLGRISPLEILHSADLLTYIGKINSYDDIEMEPILLEKENIAIYGIGYFSDKKFLALLKSGRLRFKKYENRINILMIHQNRAPIYKSYVSEDNFSSFFHLVIYGHEHEPIQMENRSGVKILQCGSSIQTSLCEGEQGKKYCYILHIENGKLEIENIMLCSPRKFYFNTFSLLDYAEAEKINFIKRELRKLVQEKLCTENKYLNLLKEILKIDIKNNFHLPLCRLRFISDEVIQRSIFDEFNDNYANVDFISYGKNKKNNLPEKKKETGDNFLFNNEFADLFYRELKNNDLNIINEYLIVDGYLNRRKGYFDHVYSKLIEKGNKLEVIDDESIRNLKGTIDKIKYENKTL